MLDLFRKDFIRTKRSSIFFLVGIFLLGFFLRFYQLGSVPNGLQQDETSIGYNAYSIVQTGRDEYGKQFPLLFKAFGEYKLPGYIYLSVIPIWFFGPNAFAVRLTAGLFGSISVVMLYFLLREMVDRKGYVLPLLSALFLAINPWHLHFSRGAFEVTPALFFIVSGSYLFFLAKRKRSLLLLLTAVLLASLSMYTYNIARLFAPLLFASYFIYYRVDRIFRSGKDRAIFALSLSLLAILFLFAILGLGGYSSTKGTLIFSSAEVQARLLEFRSYLILLPVVFTKIFFNTFVLTFLQYLQNVLSYFSISFLFLTGSSHGNHGIGNVGQMYMVEFLFVIVGIASYLRSSERKFTVLFIWAVFIIGVAAMTREAPHATRGFFLIIPLVVFSALGFIVTIRFLFSRKSIFIKYGVLAGITLLFLFNLIYYFVSYYNRFPVAYAPQWRSEDRDLIGFIQENEMKYDHILIDNNSDLLYSSILYYLPFSPSIFQQTVSRFPDDSEGFSKVKSFGKFIYKDIDWDKDTKFAKTLIVTTPKQSTGDLPILMRFYYPQRPVVAAVGQDIMQYPVLDSAYVVLEAKP